MRHVLNTHAYKYGLCFCAACRCRLQQYGRYCGIVPELGIIQVPGFRTHELLHVKTLNISTSSFSPSFHWDEPD